MGGGVGTYTFSSFFPAGSGLSRTLVSTVLAHAPRHFESVNTIIIVSFNSRFSGSLGEGANNTHLFCFRVLRHISCAQAESALSAALGWHCAAHFLCLRRRVLPALLSARRVLLQRRASHSRALFSGVPFFSFLVDRELVLVLRARRFVVRSCSCVADGRRSRPRLRRRGPGRTTARWHTSSGGAYARRAAAHDGTASLPLQRGRDC